MENTTEPISEEDAAKQQQQLAELRRYNREYCHAHKKASECEHRKETFSSVSALRRHQVKKPQKCKLLQATETIEKFNIIIRYRLVGVITTPTIPYVYLSSVGPAWGPADIRIRGNLVLYPYL